MNSLSTPQGGLAAGARDWSQRGATLLGVMSLLLMLSIGHVLVWEQISLQRQREREAQLLFVGEQYRRALASYARATPLGGAAYPLKLEELLEDRRSPKPVAHLRQLWPDPFTGKPDWQLIKVGDRIVGVHSRATVRPLRQRLPGQAIAEPESAPITVADWRFVHIGGLPR